MRGACEAMLIIPCRVSISGPACDQSRLVGGGMRRNPRVLLAERGEDVTRRLAEFMLETERGAPRAALDGIANALADVLIRRHELAGRPLPITSMEALMQETRAWLHAPDVPELRKRIADVEGELVREGHGAANALA